MAFGSMRMEPPFTVPRQRAATAADIAIQEGLGVHQVDYGILSEKFRAAGQIIEWELADS